MSYKKIASAIMAFVMAASMTAVSVNAEETENEPLADNTAGIEETQAPEPEPTSPPETEKVQETDPPVQVLTEPEQQDNETETAPEKETESQSAESEQNTSETDAPNTMTTPETTTAIGTTAIGTATTKNASETQTTATTAATVATATTATTAATEVISNKLAAPSLGEFKISSVEGADGTNAVISWNAVAGADGYQVYKTSVDASEPDMPTSYAFDVKGTSYQTAGSIPYKETIKVRAFQKVNGQIVYGPWSASKTVYMNGMKQETTATKATSKTEKTTTAATTAKKNSGKTESPKTGDSANIPAVAGAATAAALAGLAVMKKKEK